MFNKNLIGFLVAFSIFGLMIGTTYSESQIVIDPVTKTISIITSGSVDTGYINTGSVDTGTAITNDIPQVVYTGTEFEQALKWMYANGLTKYNNETEYRPNDFLTRQEAAKILGQAYTVLGYTKETKNTSCNFSDTEIMDSSLTEHVNNTCKRGLFKGSQGKFMPYKTLTRPEAMAVLIRIFEGKTSNENQALRRSDYYIKGNALGLTTLNSNSFEQEITRYEIALYINRLKNIVTNSTLKAQGLNKLANLNQSGSIAQETGSKISTDFSAIAGSISVSNDPELQEAIRWMNDNGLTSYKTIQDYKPFEILNREQSAKILLVFSQVFNYNKNLTGTLPTECNFSDISTADTSLKAYIENVCKANIMKGSSNKFSPKNTISKAEFITSIIRLFEGKKLDETQNPRWKAYYEKALDMGVVGPADAITFENAITRYEVALFLYRFKIKNQMLNSLNTNKLQNEIINTVPGSIKTGSNNLLESNVYVDMNLLQNGNFDLGYIETFGNRYKVVKSSTEKYFANNFVRYGDIYSLDNDTDKIGTASFIVSNGYVVEGTIRLTDKDYLISQLSDTNAYYKLQETN